MPMVVVITRDVEPRYRGFLGSALLELSTGIYAHPRINAAVRGRIWEVLADWHQHLHSGSIVMTWVDSQANGGFGLKVLGEPSREIVSHDAMLLVRKRLNS